MTAKILVCLSYSFGDVCVVLVPDEFSFDGGDSLHWNDRLSDCDATALETTEVVTTGVMGCWLLCDVKNGFWKAAQ